MNIRSKGFQSQHIDMIVFSLRSVNSFLCASAAWPTRPIYRANADLEGQDGKILETSFSIFSVFLFYSSLLLILLICHKLQNGHLVIDSSLANRDKHKQRCFVMTIETITRGFTWSLEKYWDNFSSDADLPCMPAEGVGV